MYAILDIETTGGKYNEEGITEIAIYQHDGQKVTDQFISLVNPERPIQPFVEKLTGINSKMLRSAPRFFELAKRIIEITENCLIVAHNADFDYRILRTEFKRLGYNFERNSLCTVTLSQQLLPEMESHKLGKLVRSLGIPISDRHRAQGAIEPVVHGAAVPAPSRSAGEQQRNQRIEDVADPADLRKGKANQHAQAEQQQQLIGIAVHQPPQPLHPRSKFN